MKKVMIGNHAVSWGARLARVEVISAYPITPQTQIVEELSEMCADGRLDARFIKVESEHSAMAACVGASAAGARAFTATSSQGLALMHEMLHWAANGRLPIVMADVNRALGPGWNIWTDQSDSLAQRDTGWVQLYCETNQEVLDTTLMAFKLAETVDLPVMLVLDAFFLSHTAEPVDVPDPETADVFLGSRAARYTLDVNDPRSFGALVKPDAYMEMRWHLQQAMQRVPAAFADVELEFAERFGRRYGAVESYRIDGADLVLVTSGTITSTARFVVDRLRERGAHARGHRRAGLERRVVERHVQRRLRPRSRNDRPAGGRHDDDRLGAQRLEHQPHGQRRGAPGTRHVPRIHQLDVRHAAGKPFLRHGVTPTQVSSGAGASAARVCATMSSITRGVTSRPPRPRM